MAKSKSVTTADLTNVVNKVNSEMQTQTSLNMMDIEEQGASITNSVNDGANLVQGSINDLEKSLKESWTDIDKEIAALEKQIAADANGMGDYFGNVISGLTDINNNIVSVTQTNEGYRVEDKKQKESDDALAIADSKITVTEGISKPNQLQASTNLPSLVGTGFGFLAGSLASLGSVITDGMTQLGAAMMDANAPLIAAATAKKDTKKDKKEDKAQGPSKMEGLKGFNAFLKEAAGPIGAIAKATVSLALAITAIGLLPISAGGMLTGVVIFATAMFATFVLVKKLMNEYKNVAPTLDEKNSKNMDNVFHLLNAITNMMLKIVVASVLVSFFLPQIIKGLGVTIFIMGVVGVAIIALSHLMDEMPDGNKLEAFTNFLKQFTNMMMITSILVIILGIIPMGILIQGFIAVIAIMALLEFSIWGLTKITEKLTKGASPAKMNALTNFLKTFTIMLGVTGLMVIVLGLMPTSVIIQGIIAVTLIFALLFISIKLISQVKIQPQAFIGLAMTAVFALAVALVGMLVAGLFSLIPGGPAAVLISAVALVMVTFALILIGFASNAMVPLGIPQMAALIPFKLLAIAFTLVIALAIAGAGILIAMIMKPEIAAAAIIGASALIATTLAIILIGFASVGLAIVAPILTAATPLALFAIGMSVVLIVAVAGVAVIIGNLIDESTAKAAAAGAVAIFQTMLAIVAVGLGSLVLAGLAFILWWTAGLALWAMSTVAGLMFGVAVVATFISELRFPSGVVDVMKDFAEFMAIFVTGLLLIIPPIILAMPIFYVAAYVLGFVAITMASMTFSMALISLSTSAISVMPMFDISDKMSQMTATLDSMTSFVEKAQSFKSMTLREYLRIYTTLGFIKSLAKRMEVPKSGDGGVEGITALADALGRLSDVQPGLANLAASMREVAEAAKDLENLNVNSKMSIETMTGGKGGVDKVKDDVAAAASAEAPEEPADDKQLNAILDALKTIADAVNDMRGSVKQGAKAQYDSNFSTKAHETSASAR